jgi:hypothetical protein
MLISNLLKRKIEMESQQVELTKKQPLDPIYMIVNIDNKFSDRKNGPVHIHYTLEAATNEANRLADKCLGSKFVIFKAIAAITTQFKVIDHYKD